MFYRRSTILRHAKTGGAIREFLGRKSEQPAPARSSAGGAECTFSLPQREFGFEVQSGGQSLRARSYADHPAARRTQIRRQAVARARAAWGAIQVDGPDSSEEGKGLKPVTLAGPAAQSCPAPVARARSRRVGRDSSGRPR